MTAIGYSIIPGLPLVQQENLQWSLAILFPVVKKLNMWLNTKFTRWAFECDQETATIEDIIFVGCIHSFSLTILLASSGIKYWTTYFLILADTLMNGLSLRKIIQLHQQGTELANQQRDRSLKTLALKEFLEILIPLVYCLSFTGSYFGPNYDIIGGMGSDLWHYQKVTSLYDKLHNILTLMMLESLRGVTFASVLWKLYGLNVYSAYCYVVRNFGWFILICGALSTSNVNGYYLSKYNQAIIDTKFLYNDL